MNSFSDRHGIAAPDAPITIRNDAPDILREAVVAFASRANLNSNTMRSNICELLGIFPDRNNWSEPNVMGEVEGLVRDAPWNNIYDFAESNYQGLFRSGRTDLAAQYAADLNKFFRRHGIGWQMSDGRIEFRGATELEGTVTRAITDAEMRGLVATPRALHEARKSLSERPVPNTRDAINNAMGALEAATRHVSGDHKPTLGEIAKSNAALFPGALRKAVEGLWGYASEEARHVREGAEPSLQVAEFVVSIAAAMAAYLLEANPE